VSQIVTSDDWDQRPRLEFDPEGVSPVIASYAVSLSDAMWRDEEARQELLVPLVPRLAGTAASKEIELRRVRHIAIETVKRVLPVLLRLAGLSEQAERCKSASDLTAAADAASAAQSAAHAIEAPLWEARKMWDREVANAAAAAICAGRAAAYAGDYAARVPRAAYYVTDNAVRAAWGEKCWRIAVEILEEAIDLGRQRRQTTC
jgi:hypothetical protein